MAMSGVHGGTASAEALQRSGASSTCVFSPCC
jgi:hypothetical protein